MLLVIIIAVLWVFRLIKAFLLIPQLALYILILLWLCLILCRVRICYGCLRPIRIGDNWLFHRIIMSKNIWWFSASDIILICHIDGGFIFFTLLDFCIAFLWLCILCYQIWRKLFIILNTLRFDVRLYFLYLL